MKGLEVEMSLVETEVVGTVVVMVKATGTVTTAAFAEKVSEVPHYDGREVRELCVLM